MCNSEPERHLISLPIDCVQPDTKRAEFDVATCGQRECSNTPRLDQTSCTDSEQEFECCQPVESRIIDLKCQGYMLPVTKVISCGCGQCMKARRKIVGRVVSVDSGKPLNFVNVYYNYTHVTGTDSVGTFSFDVPNQVRRVPLTLKDDYRLHNVMNITVVFNIGDALITYRAIRMKMVPAPQTVDDSTSENRVPLLVGDGNAVTADQVAELVVAPNSLYTNDGNMYKGSFNITVMTIDMRNITDVEVAPGDFTAIDVEGNLAELKSYGMFSFDFVDMSGNPLSLGGTSEIRVNQDLIPPCTSDEDGTCDTRLWIFNERSGSWEMASKLRDTEGGRRRRQNGVFRVRGAMDISNNMLYNIDDIITSEQCWAKVIGYNTQDLNPDDLLPNEFTVTSIIEEKGQNFLRRNNNFANSRNDIGVCVPQACDSTNPDNSRFTSHLTVDYNEYVLLPALSTNPSPSNRLDSSDLNKLQYNVLDSNLIIKPFASKDGPIFPGKSSGSTGACSRATATEKHLQFHCPTCYDATCFTVCSSKPNPPSLTPRTFYPSLSIDGEEQDYCFIGVRVYTDAATVRITVRSEMHDSISASCDSDTKSNCRTYGTRELRARKDNPNSDYIDACMEYKCSGPVYCYGTVRQFDTTKITMDLKDAGSCRVTSATSGFETHLNDKENITLPAELPLKFGDSKNYALSSGLHKTDDVYVFDRCKNDPNSPQSSAISHCEVPGNGFIPAVTITCS